jgi:uncharacterized membrane protein
VALPRTTRIYTRSDCTKDPRRFGGATGIFETKVTNASSQSLRRRETAGARCAVAALIGAVAGIVAALLITWQAAILVGWDAAAICYLAWIWTIVGHLNPHETKRHANIEDGSRRPAEAIVLIAGVALLAAVGLVLVEAGQSHGGTKAYLITIGIVSVVLSWATVHTVFMLRYARSHYQNSEGGVDFNETDPPAYLDFAYLAFTIGMTFQVSDTNLTTKPIRRIALSHALMSYLFGAVIVALAINIVASLLS